MLHYYYCILPAVWLLPFPFLPFLALPFPAAPPCAFVLLCVPQIRRMLCRDVTIEAVAVDQAGGNGIFLSNHCWRTNLLSNTIGHAGDSAIVLVGSTRYMNGTADTYPAYTNISNNLCYEMGYYGKQTAAYFKSIAYRTRLVNNVFYNSPRSLVNYNDAYRGGDLMEGNVMWGAVKETNDQ